MNLRLLIYSELSPDTGDINHAIFVGAILIALFIIFILLKGRRR